MSLKDINLIKSHTQRLKYTLIYCLKKLKGTVFHKRILTLKYQVRLTSDFTTTLL